MNCAFQLDAYQIETVSVAQNEGFEKTKPAHTGDIACTISISPNKSDATKYRLTLDITVKPTDGKETVFFPYSVAIKGRAFFSFKGACPREESERVLRLNGASILYGLLRAQVAQITAQAVHGQFLLPAMNFVELSKSQEPGGAGAASDASPATPRRAGRPVRRQMSAKP